ncbi:MAG: molybdopterin cofactor-binding domain-containing protein, partial [Pseudomonadota bacterium]|nr:molybdopterin cofactor-binding domain-containing protein [Pseudomonadota bacterium]
MGKWTRRAFITTGVVAGGGFAIGVALRPGHRAPELAGLVTEEGESLVNVWVKLDQNNVTTVIVPHSEMGQGAQTVLAQMLADEMDADWDLVRFEEAPPSPEYANYLLGYGVIGGAEIPKALAPTFDGLMLRVAKSMAMQITGGSLSIRSTGQYGMRIAGAAAREMLIEAAADTWQVPATEIQTEASHLIHAATNRRAPYAEFAPLAAQLSPPSTPELKSVDDFKIIGHDVQRLDIPSKVDGSAQFAMDVQVPGMVYATVQRSPVFGGEIAQIDDSAARSLPGVIDVVRVGGKKGEDAFAGKQNIGESVAVVAEGYWQAKQG